MPYSSNLLSKVVYIKNMGQDKYGDQVVATKADPTQHYQSTANENSAEVKASAGVLYEVRGYNASATDQFVMVFDATATPANTTVPEEVYAVGAEDNFSITWPQGKQMTTGIVITNSTSQQTLTIGGNDCWFAVDYDELGS